MSLEEQQGGDVGGSGYESTNNQSGNTESQANQNSLNIESAAKGLANDLFGEKEISEPGDESEEEAEPAEPSEAEKPEPEAKVQSKPAPASWAKERHEAWSKLSPDIQDYISLREKQMFDGVQKQAGDAKLGREINQVVQPYMATLTAQGVDAPKAITWLMNNHQILSTAQPNEKAHHLMDMARRYGVDLSLVGVRPGQQAQPAPSQDHGDSHQSYNPAVTELLQRITSMEMTIAQKEEERKKADNERVLEQVSQELESFASDPENKLFDEVADDMILFIENGYSLKDAYDRAVRANPNTYQKLIAEASTAQEKAIKEKIKQGANTAKNLTRNNLNQRNTGKAPTGPTGSLKDLDKLLSNAYDEMKQASSNY